MDCRNFLFSIKRNCEVRSSWNYSSQKTWDDPDVCLRDNLSQNLINVARLMHGSILPVTIPPADNPGDKSSPSVPGMGNCLKPSCPEGRCGGANRK